MRTVIALPAMLALALVLGVFVACGGGGDKTTSTSAASSTSSPATATTAASPVGSAATASDRGSGRGSSGAGGAPTRAASPIGTSAAGPTPTRRPDTVIATPRQIVKKTPTPGPQPTATAPSTAPSVATATTGTVSDVQALLSQDFSTDSAPFFSGTTDGGVVMGVADGMYSIALPANVWQTAVSDDTAALADGLIIANVMLGQTGYAGLVARDQFNDDGTYAFYMCWLGPGGDSGCSLNQNGAWTTLFTLDPGTIQTQDTNTLIMAVVGGDITFAVGDTIVGTATDTTIASGYWGVYAESPRDSAATLIFDNVGIAQVPPDYQLGQ